MRFGIREFLFVLVLLAIPTTAFFLIFRPWNEDLQQARAEIQEKREKLARLDETTARIEDLGAAIDGWKQAIDLIEAKLPGEQQVDQVLRQAWEIAGRHGLTIKSVEPQKKVTEALYMELPIKVELGGDFDGFYQFLLDLEQLPRLTRIKNLHMERIKDVEGAMTADFVLSIYFEPESRTMAGVTG